MGKRCVDGDEMSECGYIRAPCQCHRRISGTGGSQPHGARAQQPWTGVGEGRRTEAPQGLGTLDFSPGGLSWLPPLPHPAKNRSLAGAQSRGKPADLGGADGSCLPPSPLYPSWTGSNRVLKKDPAARWG